jgi:methionyl-tRNA formyltransferase
VRIIFLGTPEFAVPTLEALAREHEIALVVAQPDKRAGRGLNLQSPAVAIKARELGLPLAQPAKIRELKPVDADIGIVVAYGKILPADLLKMPQRGFLNVHGSILPKYRGAAPIQRAIEHGENVTGVTIMRVDEELDHGPILSVVRTQIGADERASELSRRLAQIGADAMLSTLRDLPAEIPQDHSKATHAPKIEKAEGEIRWSDSAKTIYNKFRAFDPWPGIFTGDLKLIEIAPSVGAGAPARPGTILSIDDGVTVATGDGAIRLLAVQRSGKSRQRASEFARGAGWRAGAQIS